MSGRSVAIIGSFKKHNDAVQTACSFFRAENVVVTSPLGAQVLQEGVSFVRFETDPHNWPDHAIQTLALHRIFAADLVYVIAPSGYIGRTTCYEIGRIIQRRQPLYFSEHPEDLPIEVPFACILNCKQLLELIKTPDWTPHWLFDDSSLSNNSLEQELIAGILRNE